MSDHDTPEYRIVNSSVSSAVLRSADIDDDFLTVEIEHYDSTPEFGAYLTTDEKISKIFALEVPRWFCKMPDVDSMNVRIAMPDETYTLDVDRSDLELFFDMTFDPELPVDNSRWRSEFRDPYDNPQTRTRFMNEFVEIEPTLD